jgi:hypothetical protein
MPPSKADQHAEQKWLLLLEDTPNPLTSPAALFWDWYDEVVRLLGGCPWQLCPGAPVLLPLTTGGTVRRDRGRPPKPLGPATVGTGVRRLAEQVGAPGRIRGGSLRSGLVSSLREDGATRAEVKNATGQKKDKTVDTYDRRRPGRDGTARKLGL